MSEPMRLEEPEATESEIVAFAASMEAERQSQKRAMTLGEGHGGLGTAPDTQEEGIMSQFVPPVQTQDITEPVRQQMLHTFVMDFAYFAYCDNIFTVNIIISFSKIIFQYFF